MKIKLIASDLDGTFLKDDKTIPEENLKAFEACAAKGVEIVPATGRLVAGIPEEIRNLSGVRYVIGTNGALITDLWENKEISACRIKNELAVSILMLAQNSKDDIMYDAYIDGLGYTSEYFYEHADKYAPSAAVAKLIRKTRQPMENHVSAVKNSGKDVEKVNMFFVSMEARQRMREMLAQIPGIFVSSSLPNNLEINAVGADKGSALLRLAEYLGISREETMAFGDGENDVTMIRNAGIGVAMENGEDCVKAVADHITCSNNENGVAEAIRQFVLK